MGGFVLIAASIQAASRGLWPHRGDLIPLGLATRRSWARLLLFFHGIELRVSGPGREFLNSSEAFVIVSNHQSALDILALCCGVTKPFAFLAKRELLVIPVFGWAAWLAGTVYIDRKRGANDGKALSAVRRVLESGGSISVFPEGTRSFDGQLLPFKRGAFVMALETQKRILPITIRNSHALMPKKSLVIRPGLIELVVDEPISTLGLTSEARFPLASQVQSIIAKRLDIPA